MGVNVNATPNQSVQPNSNYEVVDVDSQQDKKAAAYVQSLILEKERGNSIMDNNNNNGMSAQEQLALQQMQQMQQLQQAGQQAGSILMTGLKYGAAFGAGFLGCKLLSSNSGSSKDAESLMGAVSELFK